MKKIIKKQIVIIYADFSLHFAKINIFIKKKGQHQVNNKYSLHKV